MKINLICVFLLIALIETSRAEPQRFDFKDPKGVNNAVFKLDAPLEAITGSANGITGSVTFDPVNPAATRGKIVVASETLTVPNSMMKGHLHSEKWLDVAQFREISFEAKDLKDVKVEGNVTSANVLGTFTCKGVARELVVPVKLTYLKDKLSQRVPNMKGDLLVLRSNFKIKRSDFNIMPHQAEEKVSDEIELTLSIAGAAVR